MTDQTNNTERKPARTRAAEPVPSETERDGREARAMDNRDATARIPASWLDPSLLPDPIPEPGWVYRWVRIANGSSPDQRHVSLRFRGGWRPVTPQEQPEIAETLPKAGAGEDRIVIGELMLCKAPMEAIEARRRLIEERTANQMEGVMSQMMSQSDSRMPLSRPMIQTDVKSTIT